MKYHLAELNVARIKYPLEHPLMREFTDFLEPVNQFAEKSPGFIWRLKDDLGRSSSYVESPYSDKMVLVNLSLWKDPESLKHFTYNTAHSYFLKNKVRWFDKMYGHHMVLWWEIAGDIPTIDKGLDKLNYLNKHGPSPAAFDFKKIYDPININK